MILCGGAKRDRTADLLNAIQALSQLSYSPTFHCQTHWWKEVVGYHVWEESVKFFLVYQWVLNPYLLPSPRDFVRLRRFSWTYAIQHARTIFSVSQIGNKVRLRKARCDQVLHPWNNNDIGSVGGLVFLGFQPISWKTYSYKTTNNIKRIIFNVFAPKLNSWLDVKWLGNWPRDSKYHCLHERQRHSASWDRKSVV